MRRLLRFRRPVGLLRSPAPRRGLPAGAVFGLILALTAGSAAPVPGYVLDRAGAWYRGVWGPGETVSVAVVESSLWETPLADLSDFRRMLQEALAVWANVPTADIRWEVGPTISETEAPGTFPFIIRAVRNASEINAQLSLGPGDPHCLVNMDWPFESNDPPTRFASLWSGRLRILIHELGHCLGLDHPDVFVPRFFYGEDYSTEERASDAPSYWRFDPAMSYGKYHPDPRHLTADDMIGVSILRPREGWLDTTGSITGWVRLPPGGQADGVYHAYVLATLLEPESRAYAVGVFTDLGGHFRIQGLAPGDYQLLVRAPTGLGTPVLYRRGNGVALELRQTVRAGPVRVRAGEETGPVPLAAWRRGDPFR